MIPCRRARRTLLSAALIPALSAMQVACVSVTRVPSLPETAQFNKERFISESSTRLSQATSVFWSRVCVPDYGVTPLNTRRANELKKLFEQVKQAEEKSQVAALLYSDNPAALYVAGEYKDARAKIKRTRLDLDSSKTFEAYAVDNDPDLRVVITDAWIERLCGISAPTETKENAQSRLQRIADEAEADFGDRDVPFPDVMSVVGNAEETIFTTHSAYMESSANLAMAIAFVMAHEIGHIAFDRNARNDLSDDEKRALSDELNHTVSPEVVKQMLGVWREVRSDLYGIFLVEVLTDQRRLRERAQTRLGRTGSTGNLAEELWVMQAAPGFETMLKSVYDVGQFREGDAVHMPIDDRIEFIRQYYEQLGKQSDVVSSKEGRKE